MDADVLVLGAGFAGIAAARAARDAGLRAVVLEARDRVGGRATTDRSLGVPLDLGAAWLGAGRRNPLQDLVLGHGGRLVPWDWTDAQLRRRGRPLDARAVARRYAQVAERLRAARETAAPEDDMAEALARALDAVEARGEEREALAWWAEMEIGMFQGADLRDLGLAAYGTELDMPGDDALVASGLGALAEALAEGLDLRLRTRVRAVAHGDEGVAMRTDGRTYRAARAVVTLPLGVLRAGDVAFDPPLPPRRVAAAERLGVSLMDKVALRFATRFWGETRRVGDVDEAGVEFVDLSRATGAPVLVALARTATARALEALDDEEVVRRTLELLRRSHGADVPQPVAWRVTRWGADALARGSYVHLPPRSSTDDLRALAEPVGERLFFAGDATHPEWPGTATGAWLSGLAAGKRAAASLAATPLT